MSKLWKVISETFLRKGAMFLGGVAGVFICLLALVNFVVVVLRRSPLSGAWLSGGVEVSQELMAIVTATGLGYCWYVGGHVRIDAVIDRLKPTGRNALESLNALFAAAWMGVVIYAVFVTSRGNPTILLLSGIPVAPVQVIYCIIMLHFLLVLLRSLLGFAAKAFGR